MVVQYNLRLEIFIKYVKRKTQYYVSRFTFYIPVWNDWGLVSRIEWIDCDLEADFRRFKQFLGIFCQSDVKSAIFHTRHTKSHPPYRLREVMQVSFPHWNSKIGTVLPELQAKT